MISECSICLENKQLLILKCNHKICEDCLIKLDKCPNCRKETDYLDILENDYDKIFNQHENLKNKIIDTITHNIKTIDEQINKLTSEKNILYDKLKKYGINKYNYTYTI